ncbi:unnamed protein product, partial [Durusdinium trenchii]
EASVSIRENVQIADAWGASCAVLHVGRGGAPRRFRRCADGRVERGVDVASGRHRRRPPSSREALPSGRERKGQRGDSGALGRRQLSASAAVAAALAARRPRAARAKTGRAKDARLELVEKSPLDDRNYQALTLRNGLRVLCCSDPNADRAAAALDVHVGYFSDPDEVPGLAHFCEHMLFLGTEDFPEENSFDAYLTANSGFSNAFTEAEDTCFFFSCGTDGFAGALQRFGAFFRAPLFTESATGREVNAINSEHQKNVPNDVYRLGQVLNSRANPQHPYHRFGTGNVKTLLEDTAAKGINLRAQLLAYYQRFYRAPLMTLCLIGKEPLSELQGYAERFFGKIPGDGGEEPEAAYGDRPLFLPSAFTQGVEAVPVADVRSLQVVFPVDFAPHGHVVQLEEAPPGPEAATGDARMRLDHWRWYNLSSHVGALLGHEGPKSLTSLLRKRGWITELEVGGADNTTTFAMLVVSMELTDEGFRQKDEILKILFGYLNFVRQLTEFPKELVSENLRISDCAWITREEPGPQDAAVLFAGSMQDWAVPKYYLSGNARLRDGPGLQDTVAKLLQLLRPSNALVTVVSRSCAGTLTEPWYGTRYSLKDLTRLQKEWQNASLAPGLGLPDPNPFLPRSLELKAPRRGLPTELRAAFAAPAKRSEDAWEAYFRQDTEYGVPKAFVFVELPTSVPRGDPKRTVAARLYEAIIQDALQESLLYNAQVAGLSFSLSTSTRGVQLFFGGFDDRLEDFAAAALRAALGVEAAQQRRSFEAQLDRLRRDLESFASQPPISQAAYWSGLALIRPEFSLQELLEATKRLRLEDVSSFAVELWDSCRRSSRNAPSASLCWGNLREDEGESLVRRIRDILGVRLREEVKEAPAPRIAQVPVRPQGPGVVLVHEVMDGTEENAAVEVIFQGGTTRGGAPEALERLAEMQVLSSVMSDAFYEQLRTREQLGYIVSCRADRNEGVFSLVCVVQGAAKSALEVLKRIDAFLDSVPDTLKAKSDAEIQSLADSLAQARLARPQQLLSAVERSWGEIRSQEFLWSRPLDEALALRKVRKAQVIEAFNRWVRPGGAERRRLCSLVLRGAEAAARQLEGEGAEILSEPQRFAQVQPAWPAGKAVTVTSA